MCKDAQLSHAAPARQSIVSNTDHYFADFKASWPCHRCSLFSKIQASSAGEQVAGVVESVMDLFSKFELLDLFHDRADAATADCLLFLASCVDAVGGIDWLHSNRSFAIQRECRIIQFRSDVSDVPMNSATPAIQDLARRLIALEAMCDAGSIAGRSEAVRVCEKLRVPLAKFLGIGGYRSLMARALAMAKAETPSLDPVQVQPDGSLDWIGQIDADAAVVVLVNLLGLLTTFVGERMTLRLVLDGWSDASLNETDSSVEEQS